MSPILVLLVFPLFCGHFGCLWAAQTHRVLSTPIVALSALQKHYILKENAPLTRKMLQNLGRTKGQMVQFSRMHIPTYSHFPAFLCSGKPTQPKKISRFAMCIFEPALIAQQVDSDLRPANSPNHATDAGVQLMWERVLCNSSASNSPSIFLCNRLHEMSLHISENEFPNNFFVRVIFLV